jgi:hypothetical protein
VEEGNPFAVELLQKRRSFLSAFAALSARIQLLLSLPIEKLDARALKTACRRGGCPRCKRGSVRQRPS